MTSPEIVCAHHWERLAYAQVVIEGRDTVEKQVPGFRRCVLCRRVWKDEQAEPRVIIGRIEGQ